MKNPYIGITGFRNSNEVTKMLDVFNRYKPQDTPYMLHVGAMMSRRTMLGIKSRFTNAFPKTSEYGDIFGNIGAYNCLHYADFDTTPDPGLEDHLIQAIGYCGNHLNAIQLDITWPSTKVVSRIHSLDRHCEIILQIGKKPLVKLEIIPTHCLIV